MREPRSAPARRRRRVRKNDTTKFTHSPRGRGARLARFAGPADPFAVGATVELRGLVSNAAANGRHVVVVQTPPDVADRGRINVCLDGDVKAVKRENVVPVPSAGVGSAPSSAAMAWLTPGFLSSSLHGYWSDESCGI